MLKKIFIIILCLTILILSCDKITNVDEYFTLYLNSFETAEDTTGWTGITDQMFVSDPAPDSGQKSLLIGGGCPQPAASLIIGEQSATGVYHIKCWAKINEEGQQGSLRLSRFDEEEELHTNRITLTIDAREWTYYETEVGLNCSAGQTLFLEILIGGFVPASMNLDLLAIERE